MAVVNSNNINLQEAVSKIMQTYSTYVYEAAYEAIDEVSKEAVKKLKATSPRATGEYAKNWARKLDKQRLTVGATIYNKAPTYRLTHLLENGHAKRGGGRVPAKPHIKPVEEWANDEVWNRIVDKVSEGFKL